MSPIFARLQSHTPEIKKNSGIIFQERRYSYDRFLDDIHDAVRGLESEKKPSRFIFWHGKDYYALLCLFAACMRTGRILLPGMSLKRLAEAAEHIPFGAVFENFRRTDSEIRRPADHLPQFTEGGLLLSTSGTTSEPRWALLSEKMLSGNALTAITLQQLSPHDRVLAFSGLGHTGGWNINLLPGILAGAEVHLVGRFSPYQSLRLIRSHTSVKTHLSPPQINLWQNLKSWDAADLRPLRMLVTGSSEVWPRTVRQLLQKGVGQTLRNYGLTEAGPMIFCETASSPDDDLETYTHRSRGLATRLDDEHRLLVQGDTLFSGYIRDGRLTSAPGLWWDTGDLFIQNKNRLHFAGRANDRIFIGGRTLYPSLVEGEILGKLSDLRECALVRQVGSPQLCLFYSGRKTADENLVRQAAERATETPVHVFRCKHLPRNLSGKIDRVALRNSPAGHKRILYAQI